MAKNGAMQLQVIKPVHKKCIQLLLEKGDGHGAREAVAKELEIRPQTITDWKKSPAFMKEYWRAREEWELALAGEHFASLRSRFRTVADQIDNVQQALKYSASAAETAACAKTIASLVEQLGEMVKAPKDAPTEPGPPDGAIDAPYTVEGESVNPLTQIKAFSAALDYFVAEFQAGKKTCKEFADAVREEAG